MPEQKKLTDRWWFWALLLLLLWWLWRKRKRQLAAAVTSVTPPVDPAMTTAPAGVFTPPSAPSPLVQQDPIWTPTIVPDVPPVVGEEVGNFSYLTTQGFAQTGYSDAMIEELGPDVQTYLNGWNFFYPTGDGRYADSGQALWTHWWNVKGYGGDTSEERSQITRYMKGWNLSHSG